jgi:hypothetical protein
MDALAQILRPSAEWPKIPLQPHLLSGLHPDRAHLFPLPYPTSLLWWTVFLSLSGPGC